LSSKERRETHEFSSDMVVERATGKKRKEGEDEGVSGEIGEISKECYLSLYTRLLDRC
jgi:hypothetical protein